MSLPPIGFVRPELLGLLLLAPLLAALVVVAARARERALRTFAGTTALSARSRSRMWLKNGLLLAAFVSVAIALAGPYVDLRARGARRLGVDIVLAIDVSQSMATRDVQPDRLRAARHVAQELGERMVGSRVSLVLFAGTGTTRYPPTTDPRILGEVLDNSGKGVRVQQGSSLAAAIESALAAFPLERDSPRGRAIVVVSDGEVTLESTPDLATLAEREVRLYTVGVGTPTGGQIPTYKTDTGEFTGYLRGPSGETLVSRLDESGLQELAASGGGRYWRYAGDDRVLGELASTLRTLESIEPVENAGSVPDERTRAFIAIAVGAILAERLLTDRRRMPSPREAQRAGRPRRRRRVLGLALGSSLLWAAACGDAPVSLDRANAMFAAGDHGGALAIYRDGQLRLPDSPELAINAGNALHLLGDHQHALGEYAHAIDVAPPELRAVAQYDRGNTLFRLGRLEDARDAYREALRLVPDDRDAKFNLEVVTRLLVGRRQSESRQPGPSGEPGASSTPGGGQGASGFSGPPGTSPQPGTGTGEPTSPLQQGDPTNSRDPGEPSAADLRNALNSFRRGLTIDDALLVLDALDGQQRGIEQLIEGPRRGDPSYREY